MCNHANEREMLLSTDLVHDTLHAQLRALIEHWRMEEAKPQTPALSDDPEYAALIGEQLEIERHNKARRDAARQRMTMDGLAGRTEAIEQSTHPTVCDGA